jgi:glycosyltransferase involved in cell wall biosynthesis
MVSTEYPPMAGGVGRYTSNLTKKLQNLGVDVYVACNENGDGDFSGLSPTNPHNSQVLSTIVSKIKPDIVHIQFEPGLYGLTIDPKNPMNTGTYIDKFYQECKDVPIVTTFHSAYSLSQWLKMASLVKKDGRIGELGIPLRFLIRLWKCLLNYQSFKTLNEEKLRMSRAGIALSYYLSHLIGGGQVIYHGAEPAIFPRPCKKEARDFFSLPQQKRIALLVGFGTITKGWDILKEMRMPDNWIIVINSSRSHYNNEDYGIMWKESTIKNNRIIDLQRGFLAEEELSMLFYAADAVLLPYKVTATSGVMFDALAHGLPFIATDLEFFREFAGHGLGIVTKGTADEISRAIKKLENDYPIYIEAVNKFKDKTRWNDVALQHTHLYNSLAETKITWRLPEI